MSINSSAFVGYDHGTDRQEERQNCNRHDRKKRHIKNQGDHRTRVANETTSNEKPADHQGRKKSKQVLLIAQRSREPNGSISAQIDTKVAK